MCLAGASVIGEESDCHLVLSSAPASQQAGVRLPDLEIKGKNVLTDKPKPAVKHTWKIEFRRFNKHKYDGLTKLVVATEMNDAIEKAKESFPSWQQDGYYIVHVSNEDMQGPLT